MKMEIPERDFFFFFFNLHYSCFCHLDLRKEACNSAINLERFSYVNSKTGNQYF